MPQNGHWKPSQRGKMEMVAPVLQYESYWIERYIFVNHLSRPFIWEILNNFIFPRWNDHSSDSYLPLPFPKQSLFMCGNLIKRGKENRKTPIGMTKKWQWLLQRGGQLTAGLHWHYFSDNNFGTLITYCLTKGWLLNRLPLSRVSTLICRP